MIPVAEWTPDSPELGGGGTEAKNVIAAARSYRPFPGLNEYSAAAGGSTVSSPMKRASQTPSSGASGPCCAVR